MFWTIEEFVKWRRNLTAYPLPDFASERSKTPLPNFNAKRIEIIPLPQGARVGYINGCNKAG